MTDLSVIIVNRNNEELLGPCLNSIKDSTHRASYEIIFVDNGSTDGSLRLIKTKFPQVKIIENKANLGFSRANNQGWEIARGRYALLLNTDTLVRDGAFDRMLEFMDKNPRAGACGPQLTDENGRPQHQGGLFARKFWLAKEPVAVDYVLGACLMVRREVIDRVGGLDENFFFSNDDLDWGLRIRKAGWQVYFLPQAAVVHFGGFTIKHFNQRLFVEGFRGGLYFCRKHYGWIAYQLYRGLLAIAMLIVIPLTAILYPLLPNKAKLGAYWQIFMICLSGKIISTPYSLSPTPYPLPPKILLVSNGHAEDLAAA
ncbi:MAG TPA: glycosyltransferase family 2 protein, partial [Candidatus Sulfotelmatobacter sp.]|nr:glycosyltransferase family 2 protein [Candidatus Sulfotelmatobacter sp.]